MLTSRRLGSISQLQLAATNNPPLRSGASGAGVVELQSLMADLGAPMRQTYRSGSADGIYGQETVAAVSDFQTRNGLTTDGIAGRQTLQILDSIVCGTPALEIPAPADAVHAQGSNKARPLGARSLAMW